jgi:hypothetical protein
MVGAAHVANRPAAELVENGGAWFLLAGVVPLGGEKSQDEAHAGNGLGIWSREREGGMRCGGGGRWACRWSSLRGEKKGS